MHYVVGIFGFICTYYLIKYREKVGDALGEAEWMKKVGGVYMLVIYLSLFLFILSFAILTQTLNYFFAPIFYFLPFMQNLADSQR